MLNSSAEQPQFGAAAAAVSTAAGSAAPTTSEPWMHLTAIGFLEHALENRFLRASQTFIDANGVLLSSVDREGALNPCLEMAAWHSPRIFMQIVILAKLQHSNQSLAYLAPAAYHGHREILEFIVLHYRQVTHGRNTNDKKAFAEWVSSRELSLESAIRNALVAAVCGRQHATAEYILRVWTWSVLSSNNGRCYLQNNLVAHLRDCPHSRNYLDTSLYFVAISSNNFATHSAIPWLDPIALACAMNDVKMVALFLAYGADIAKVDFVQGQDYFRSHFPEMPQLRNLQGYNNECQWALIAFAQAKRKLDETNCVPTNWFDWFARNQPAAAADLPPPVGITAQGGIHAKDFVTLMGRLREIGVAISGIPSRATAEEANDHKTIEHSLQTNGANILKMQFRLFQGLMVRCYYGREYRDEFKSVELTTYQYKHTPHGHAIRASNTPLLEELLHLVDEYEGRFYFIKQWQSSFAAEEPLAPSRHFATVDEVNDEFSTTETSVIAPNAVLQTKLQIALKAALAKCLPQAGNSANPGFYESCHKESRALIIAIDLFLKNNPNVNPTMYMQLAFAILHEPDLINNLAAELVKQFGKDQLQAILPASFASFFAVVSLDNTEFIKALLLDCVENEMQRLFPNTKAATQVFPLIQNYKPQHFAPTAAGAAPSKTFSSENT